MPVPSSLYNLARMTEVRRRSFPGAQYQKVPTEDKDGEEVTEVYTAVGTAYENWWKRFTFLLIVVCAILVITVGALLRKDDQGVSRSVSCAEDEGFSREIEPDSFFHDLTLDEIKAVRSFLLGDKSLNLKDAAQATFQDNFIFGIEKYLPRKDEVVNYWAKPGPEKPTRRARAVILMGAEEPPFVVEYLVDPLPNPSRKVELILNGRARPIPFNQRPFTARDSFGIDIVVRGVTARASRILLESFGLEHRNCVAREPCLEFSVGPPDALSRGVRRTWASAQVRAEGLSAFPLPFQILVDHTDQDLRSWKAIKLLYNDQLFDSVEELVEKYEEGAIAKTEIEKPGKDAFLRATSPSRLGSFFDFDPRSGPDFVEPDGRRFTASGNRVTYGAWNVEVGTQSSAGLAVYNVRFRNERIAYELSLQEGLSFSTSDVITDDRVQLTGMHSALGTDLQSLVRGVDCPENSLFLDAHSLWGSFEPVFTQNAICIFETNAGLPSRRHFENSFRRGHFFRDGFYYYSAAPDNALVIRTVLTRSSNDYVVDFVFHQNGVFELKASLTGYMHGAYRMDRKTRSGGRMSVPLRDHFLLVKADLDIIDEKSNSFVTYDIVVKNESFPFGFPGESRIKKHIRRSKRRTEKDALIKFNFDHPKDYIVENEDAITSSGLRRGYRIQSKYMVKNLFPDDHVATRLAPWTKYHLAVTKYKEDEPFGSSLYSQYGGDAFDFDEFHEPSESIEKEDLVAWVVVGGLDFPVPDDMPTSSTVGSQYSLALRPFGFFDEDQSTRSKDGIFVLRREDGTHDVDTLSFQYESTCGRPRMKDSERWLA